MLKSSTLGLASSCKVDLLGMFNGQKRKSTSVFLKIIRKKKKIIRGKGDFIGTKNSFWKMSCLFLHLGLSFVRK